MFIKLPRPLIQHILTIAGEFEKYRFINFSEKINEYIKSIFGTELFLWQYFIRKYPDKINQYVDSMLCSNIPEVINLSLAYTDKEMLISRGTSDCAKMIYYRLIGVPDNIINKNTLSILKKLFVKKKIKDIYSDLVYHEDENIIKYIITTYNITDEIITKKKLYSILPIYLDLYKGKKSFSKKLMKIYLRFTIIKDFLKLLDKKDIIDIIYKIMDKPDCAKYYIRYIMKKDYRKIRGIPYEDILKYFFIYVEDIRWEKIINSNMSKLIEWAILKSGIADTPYEKYFCTNNKILINRAIEAGVNIGNLNFYSIRAINILYKRRLINLRVIINMHNDKICLEYLKRFKNKDIQLYDRKAHSFYSGKYSLNYLCSDIKLLKALLETKFSDYKKLFNRIEHKNIMEYFIDYCINNKIIFQGKIQPRDFLNIIKLKIKYIEYANNKKFDYNNLLYSNYEEIVLYGLDMGATDYKILLSDNSPPIYKKLLALKYGISDFGYNPSNYELIKASLKYGISGEKIFKGKELKSNSEIEKIILWHKYNN